MTEPEQRPTEILRPNPRLTVVGGVYYQPVDEQPREVKVQFTRQLASREDTCTKRVVVSEAWTALETWWLKGKSVGLVVLRNEGGEPLRVIPTPEQAAEIAARVLEVGFLPPEPEDVGRRSMWSQPRPDPVPVVGLLVSPGEAYPVYLADPERVVLRCRCGETRVVVTLIPG